MRITPSVGGVWWVVTCTEVMRMHPRSHKTCLCRYQPAASTWNHYHGSWMSLLSPPFLFHLHYLACQVTWSVLGRMLGVSPHHSPPLHTPWHHAQGMKGGVSGPTPPAKHLHSSQLWPPFQGAGFTTYKVRYPWCVRRLVRRTTNY